MGHWTFAWFAFASEQAAHGQGVAVGEFVAGDGEEQIARLDRVYQRD